MASTEDLIEANTQVDKESNDDELHESSLKPEPVTSDASDNGNHKPKTEPQDISPATSTNQKENIDLHQTKDAEAANQSSGGVSISMLTERQTIYKAASSKAKQENKLDVAKYYQEAVREIDYLIREAEIGFPIASDRVPKVYSIVETTKPTAPNISDTSNAKSGSGPNNTTIANTKNNNNENVAGNQPVDGGVGEEEEDDDGFILVNNNPTKIIEKDRVDAYKKLVKQLTAQAEKCKNYEEQFMQNDDMAMAAKFKIHASTCAKDLELLHIRWKNGDKFPLVKYETIEFTIAPCNVELSSNELSLEIVKGINFPVSSSQYTYIIATFAHQSVRSSSMPQALCNWLRNTSNREDLFCLPQDSNQTGKVTAKQSPNPNFNHKLKFFLDRNNRSALRVLRRRPIKLDVFKREPFWKCDTKIGTISIKLGDLANKCTLHECHSIMNGRKTTDSKVEAIVRIRNALVSQEPESVHERLLIFT